MATQSNIILPWVHFSNLPRQLFYMEVIGIQLWKGKDHNLQVKIVFQ